MVLPASPPLLLNCITLGFTGRGGANPEELAKWQLQVDKKSVSAFYSDLLPASDPVRSDKQNKLRGRQAQLRRTQGCWCLIRNEQAGGVLGSKPLPDEPFFCPLLKFHTWSWMWRNALSCVAKGRRGGVLFGAQYRLSAWISNMANWGQIGTRTPGRQDGSCFHLGLSEC